MEKREHVDQQRYQASEDVEINGNKYLTSRRAVLSVLGALGLGVTSLPLLSCTTDQSTGLSATSSPVAQKTSTTAAPASTPVPACQLAPELTEGPYYLELEKVRRDVTEGKAGIPLKLQVIVVDTNACKVVEGAAVDIWHCDALGVYSGIEAQNTVGQTFLRGTQLTNSSGVAEFLTIYPGWYVGRALHIHVKVHVGGSISGNAYRGGHVSHTGQFFFDEGLTDIVKQQEPYNGRNAPLTPLAQDSIYPKDNAAGTLLKLTPLGTGNVRAGYLGEVVVGVNPQADPPLN